MILFDIIDLLSKTNDHLHTQEEILLKLLCKRALNPKEQTIYDKHRGILLNKLEDSNTDVRLNALSTLRYLVEEGVLKVNLSQGTMIILMGILFSLLSDDIDSVRISCLETIYLYCKSFKSYNPLCRNDVVLICLKVLQDINDEVSFEMLKVLCSIPLVKIDTFSLAYEEIIKSKHRYAQPSVLSLIDQFVSLNQNLFLLAGNTTPPPFLSIVENNDETTNGKDDDGEIIQVLKNSSMMQNFEKAPICFQNLLMGLELSSFVSTLSEGILQLLKEGNKDKLLYLKFMSVEHTVPNQVIEWIDNICCSFSKYPFPKDIELSNPEIIRVKFTVENAKLSDLSQVMVEISPASILLQHENKVMSLFPMYLHCKKKEIKICDFTSLQEDFRIENDMFISKKWLNHRFSDNNDNLFLYIEKLNLKIC